MAILGEATNGMMRCIVAGVLEAGTLKENVY